MAFVFIFRCLMCVVGFFLCWELLSLNIGLFVYVFAPMSLYSYTPHLTPQSYMHTPLTYTPNMHTPLIT